MTLTVGGGRNSRIGKVDAGAKKTRERRKLRGEIVIYL